MSEVRKVLFTTDFSDLSNHALPYAIKMAKIYNAELIMLHAVTIYDNDLVPRLGNDVQARRGNALRRRCSTRP